jgi:hypothetical protein
MQNKFSKIIFTFSFVLLGSFFFSAEKAQADCVVNQANFRALNTSGQPISQFTATGWYTDAVKPYVYVDVQTSGCNGQTLEFSLTESDAPGTNAWVDDDVNGTQMLGTGLEQNDPTFCNTSNPSCLDNRPLSVGAAASESNFTLVLQTGEDECDTTSNPDCIYYVRFNDDPAPASADNINQVPTLKYQCDTTCDENWSFIAKINFMGVYAADPNNPDNIDPNNPSTPTGPGISGQDIDINIQNPIGPSNMTLVDFIEKVINFALTIGIPIIAIAIIYAGLLFVTARGNDSQLETAKNAFTYAVIGGAILLGSWIFAKLIKETIESIAMISNYFV